MAEVTNDLSVDVVAQMIALGLANQPTSFVGGGSPMTVANLLANFPAGAANAGKYAQVSDLFNAGVSNGGVNEIVRCRYDAANAVYRWVPQREAFNVTMTPTGGSVSLLPLITPPTIRLAGTLLGNLTVTPSAANAYIGQRYTVVQNSTLGLFTTSVTGLLGSNLTVLGNTTQELEYTAAGWAKATP